MLSLGGSRSCFNTHLNKSDIPYGIYCCYFLPVWWRTIWTTYWQLYHKYVCLNFWRLSKKEFPNFLTSLESKTINRNCLWRWIQIYRYAWSSFSGERITRLVQLEYVLCVSPSSITKTLSQVSVQRIWCALVIHLPCYTPYDKLQVKWCLLAVAIYVSFRE